MTSRRQQQNSCEQVLLWGWRGCKDMEGKARGQHTQLHREVKPESKRAWLVSRTHDNEESGQGEGPGGGVWMVAPGGFLRFLYGTP